MKRQLKNSIVRDIKGDDIPSLRVRITPNVPSEVQSPDLEETNKTGGLFHDAISNLSTTSSQGSQSKAHWYTLRCTYGRERKAYDFFTREGFKAFYPVITTLDPDKENIKELSIPNILFVYGTFEQLKVYVYDNHQSDTKYLRFYYNRGYNADQEPMIIPEKQMASLMKICEIDADDKHLEPFVVDKFKNGTRVKVIDGPYKGIEGIVKRYKGQQRLGVVVDNIFTITTSYISKEKIKPLTENSEKLI